jgi:hypothetical protein
MELIKPLRKVICSSRYALKTSAFDLVNTPSGSFRLGGNDTITADIPKGILGGSVARASGDWEAREGIHTAQPLGLFAGQSEGNAFENSPAIASGIVPIYFGGGDFLVYVFETHAHESAYAAKTLSTAYAVGTALYCSAFGLLTNEVPSAHGTPGVDVKVAIVTKTPSASDLEMGIQLVI